MERPALEIPGSSLRSAALLVCVVSSLFLAARGGGESAGEAPPDEETASDSTEGGEASGQECPDVLEAEIEASGDAWNLDVPERYADGWRVPAPDGTVLGEHELMRDHASEQPFTRTRTGLEIPDGVEEITVEGRDLENGYGGETVAIPVERE